MLGMCMTTQFALLRQAQDDATPVPDCDASQRSTRRAPEPGLRVPQPIEEPPGLAPGPSILPAVSDPASADEVLCSALV